MRRRDLNPKIDLVFRKLFGSEENKDLLISLINSVVEPRIHVTDVVIKNPFNLATYKGAKESIVDIKAQDQDENWYDIEMQILEHIFYGKRAMFYAAKEFVDQLKSGQDYSVLNTTIGIHFLDFEFFADERIVRHFAFRDMETGEYSNELGYLQLYFVEMGKFHKEWSQINTLLDRWLAFLTKAQDLDRSQLPVTMQSEPAITKAVAELARMGADRGLREAYEAEEKAKMVDAATLQFVEQRGEERGELRGEKRGELRGQQRLLLRQMTRHIGEVPPGIEARLNTLTPAQLDDLGEALFDLNSYTDVEVWFAQQ